MAFCIQWPKYWSFSFSIRSSNEHSGLISFRIDWLDLLAVQGTLKSLLQSLGKVLNRRFRQFPPSSTAALSWRKGLKSDLRVRPGEAQERWREEVFPDSGMFLEQVKQGKDWEAGSQSA